jgi:hypothetical protein
VLVVAAGYNDVGWGPGWDNVITTAQIATACATYCAAARAAYPNTLIFVLGPWSGGRGPDTYTTATDAAMAAAVVALGDPKTFYIPQNPAPNSGAAAWITGTGYVGATTLGAGIGNSNWATSSLGKPHPSSAGHALLGYLAAQQIGAAIMTL